MIAENHSSGITTTTPRLGTLLTRTTFLAHRRLPERIGMTAPALRILNLLAERDGQSQAAIERAMNADGATVTRLAKQLQQDGLVRRVPDPADNRFTCVFLTRAGRERLAEVAPKLEAFDRALYAGIGPDDLATFRRVLDMIRSNLAAMEKPE